MQEDLSTRVCGGCGEVAEQVVATEPLRRKGWYCKHCKHFEPAIGRERIYRGKNDVTTDTYSTT